MSVDTFDCEPAEFERQNKVRARKPHRCCACGDAIPVGDVYTVHVSKWDGQISQIRRCLRCDAIYDHLNEIMPCDEAPAWRLDCGHTYRERWGEDPPHEIAALAFMTGHDLQTRKP